MPSDLELAWLAGFFDGEGCIAVYNQQRVAFAQLVTTCERSRDRVAGLMRDLGASPRVNARAVTDPSRHRQTWVVVLSRTDELAVMARAVLPFAVTKHRNWQLILEWCESRPGKGRRRGAGRLARDTEIIGELKALNYRGLRSLAPA